MSASSQGTSSPLQVGLNIAKLCTGAGLLGLPRAFQQSGIIAGASTHTLTYPWDEYKDLTCEYEYELDDGHTMWYR
jgi:hypothetical protein